MDSDKQTLAGLVLIISIVKKIDLVTKMTSLVLFGVKKQKSILTADGIVRILPLKKNNVYKVLLFTDLKK